MIPFLARVWFDAKNRRRRICFVTYGGVGSIGLWTLVLENLCPLLTRASLIFDHEVQAIFYIDAFDCRKSTIF